MPYQLVSSLPHYRDHIRPVLDALKEMGDEPVKSYPLIAGFQDVQSHPGVDYVYIEHGAGQTYRGMESGAAGSYAGGRGHNRCIGFVCPNDSVAQAWRTQYPMTPTAVVGCPKLDSWHAGDHGEPERNTVAITFHWNAEWTGVPETRSAFPEFVDGLAEVITSWKRQGWHVVGHNHPRYSAVADFWQQKEIAALGVEYVSQSSEVLSRASILVADNTSLQAEFLSLGRPVVWLNSHAYRLDVDHGGRFWEWPNTYGGCQIDSAQSLAALDLSQVSPATSHPYAFADGFAAKRAASAIRSWTL